MNTTTADGETITGTELATQLIKHRIPEVINFTEDVRKDIKKEHFKEFEKVAQEEFNNFKSDDERTLFIVSGVSFGIQIRLAHTLGAQNSTLPAVYIFKPKTHERGHKYKMSLGPDEKIT